MAKKQGIGKRMAFGSVISSDFFARHWLPTVIFVIVMVIYITTKFTYRHNIERIAALERQLEIVENEKDRERSSFMSRTRETTMQQMVDSLNLGLRVQPQPPFRIAK
ncbi:MAG: FtsL-like putative cell division protein [Muribaculaceae bacterium]|nr:FtsL-like putative cell division protein [Muribaculaceae bacterium]